MVNRKRAFLTLAGPVIGAGIALATVAAPALARGDDGSGRDHGTAVSTVARSTTSSSSDPDAHGDAVAAAASGSTADRDDTATSSASPSASPSASSSASSASASPANHGMAVSFVARTAPRHSDGDEDIHGDDVSAVARGISPSASASASPASSASPSASASASASTHGSAVSSAARTASTDEDIHGDDVSAAATGFTSSGALATLLSQLAGAIQHLLSLL